MNQIKKILKEELSKREMLKQRVRTLFMNHFRKTQSFSVQYIQGQGFDYQGIHDDCLQWVREWVDSCMEKVRNTIPSSPQQEAVFDMLADCSIEVNLEKPTEFTRITFIRNGKTLFLLGIFSNGTHVGNYSTSRVFPTLRWEYSLGDGDAAWDSRVVDKFIQQVLEDIFGLRFRVVGADLK